MRTLKEYWDIRYQQYGSSGSGTFTHLEVANDWFYKAKLRRLKEVLEWSEFKGGGTKILDAACGSGRFIPFFAGLDPKEVVGADVSDTAIKLCADKYKELLNVRFVCNDLADPLPSEFKENFDLVCIFEAIFLFTNEASFTSALRNLAQAVKPGGYLIISDNFPPSTRQVHERLVHYSKGIYKSILESEGLYIEKLYLQTKIFNRHILPAPFQSFIEKYVPQFLYLTDRLLLCFPFRSFTSNQSNYYCVVKKIK